MGKRKKESTSPSKEGGIAGDIMFAIGEISEEYVTSLNSEISNIKAAGDFAKVRDCMVKHLKGVVTFQTRMSSHLSDLCNRVTQMEDLLEKAQAREAKANEKIESMERIRESTDIKASRAEMGKKMEVAVTQVKILDLSLDTQTDDRKELMHAVRCRLKAKVKADDQPRYEELVRKSAVQVLANKSVKRKRKSDGQDIWTAPVVLAIPDRETRWEMEDLLRRSKIYPTFHWPKEFLDPLKRMREELSKKIDEDSHYVRIRPVLADGKWRIRADTRAKEGNDRFSAAASWEMPPLDPALRDRLPNWFTPTWAQAPKARAGGPAPPPRHTGGGGGGSEDEEDMEP